MSPRDAALLVVRRIRAAGRAALFAGGCVRDMLLKKRPHDYDVATDAHPEAIVEMFRRTRKVGMKFGVVLVGVQRHWIEVATFRTDVNYVDGRRPERVEFTDAREDAVRRDFTINGMFYDPVAREVIDYVNGRADLAARLIRAIGEPSRRFAEDHLRMLRAIRFAARFGFQIEPATRAAIVEHAAAIEKISPERIHDELEAILTRPSRAWAFGELHQTGLLNHLWPGSAALSAHAPVTQAVLAALPPKASFHLALAVLLHRLPLPQVTGACQALRTSNRVSRSAVWLAERHDVLSNPDVLSLADLKLLMASPLFPELMALFRARLRAEHRPLTPYRAVAARARRIPPDEVAPPPLINGDHLAQLGVRQGPLYKSILDRVYYAQLNGEVVDRPAAKTLARRLIDESTAGPERAS